MRSTSALLDGRAFADFLVMSLRWAEALGTRPCCTMPKAIETGRKATNRALFTEPRTIIDADALPSRFTGMVRTDLLPCPAALERHSVVILLLCRWGRL